MCSPRLQPDPLAQSNRTGEKMGRWAGGRISTGYSVRTLTAGVGTGCSSQSTPLSSRSRNVQPKSFLELFKMRI